MHALVLKLDNPNTSYRLSKNATKMGGKKQGYIAFGFLKFVGFRPVTNSQSKHIIGKVFSRATERMLYSFLKLVHSNTSYRLSKIVNYYRSFLL